MILLGTSLFQRISGLGSPSVRLFSSTKVFSLLTVNFPASSRLHHQASLWFKDGCKFSYKVVKFCKSLEHYKKYCICPRFIKSVEEFCVTNSLNIEIVTKTKKLHIYKCVGLISKVHAFKCIIFVVKKVHTLKRRLL